MKDIHVGVTGLRRSGKTVFLTAMLYQLLERGSQDLSIIEKAGVKLHPARELLHSPNGDQFPYQDCLASLRQSPPEWPSRTQEETHARVELRCQRNKMRRAVNLINVELDLCKLTTDQVQVYDSHQSLNGGQWRFQVM